MMLGDREVSMEVVVKYCRACKYNERVGTNASDAIQRDAYHDVFRCAGVDPMYNTPVATEFTEALYAFVDELIYLI